MLTEVCDISEESSTQVVVITGTKVSVCLLSLTNHQPNTEEKDTLSFTFLMV